METTYAVHGMHCAGCVTKVTEALEGVRGVREAEVSLESAQARVTLDDPVDVAELDRAVRAKGDYRIAAPVASGKADEHRMPSAPADATPRESLYPLALVVAYILGVVLLVAWITGGWSRHAVMGNFMAGFFLVFSFFKLLDVRGFVDAYCSYDLVAGASRGWAWVYPFIELALGVAYLTGWAPRVTSGITLVLMLVGAAGVLRALRRKQSIRCACLGTALNLPMTKVTLIEDLTMAAMAALMLV